MIKKKIRAPRDTVNYSLYGPLGNKVYDGITKRDPESRFKEHEKDKFFTSTSVSPKRTNQTAERKETEAIHSHQRQNFGIPSQYNKAKVDQDMAPSFGLFNGPKKRKSRRSDD